MAPIFHTNAAFCVLNQDQSFITFSQGLTIILKDKNELLAQWFDKLAFQERIINIDSFTQTKNNISLNLGTQQFDFHFIDHLMYQQIIAKNWIRKDLVKDLHSDQEIQEYFSMLNAYS